MKLVHSWAQEYVKMPKPDRVRELLDAAGLPVEGIASGVTLPKTVVVGYVRSVEHHPNADRLHVTQVDTGAEVRTIVCGAPNVAEGQKVAVALPGTTLPNGAVIEPATIRGVASNGMLCSAAELGLAEESTGIIILNPKSSLGQTVQEALATDPVYDIAVTPNRSDCLSVIGLAREIAAAQKLDLLTIPSSTAKTGKSPVTVKLIAKKSCLFYSAQQLDNVRVTPSPLWMRERLQLAGIRPINIVVDVTNYVMLEYGQPLHAFDTQNITDQTIIIRSAKQGEKFQTLDGVHRELDATMTVVADSEKAVALGGVMGGEQSGITDATTSVILESALFPEQAVYDTSRKLKLVSESSQRFSKGVDPSMVLPALARATELLEKHAGAKAVGGVVKAGAIPITKKSVPLTMSWFNAFLGTKLKRTDIVSLLKRLSITVTGAGDKLVATPPSFRHDLTLPEDIAEEVARSITYSAIVPTLPRAQIQPVPLSPMDALTRSLRSELVMLGGHEHIGYAYVPESMVTDKEHAVRILNPLSKDQEYLRTSLVPGMVAVAGTNAKRYDEFRLFEFGKMYAKHGSDFHEHDQLILCWYEKNAVRNLKGAVEFFLTTLWPDLQFQFQNPEGTEQVLLLNNKEIGSITVLTDHERGAAKLTHETALAVLELEDILASAGTPKMPNFRAIAQFPPVKRDIAFWVEKSTPYGTIEAVLKGVDSLLVGTELFDNFVQGDRRSLAFHLLFQAPDRTLAAVEVEKIMSQLSTALQQSCKATIRR